MKILHRKKAGKKRRFWTDGFKIRSSLPDFLTKKMQKKEI